MVFEHALSVSLCTFNIPYLGPISGNKAWVSVSNRAIRVNMLDNHLYNLMLQLAQEHKSLWRIKNHYLQDAGDCADCKAFWEKMTKDKEDHINELMDLIKKHMQ